MSTAFFARIISTACLILTPAFASAQVLITPLSVDSSAPVEQALQENKGYASTSIEGQGSKLRLTYQASEPVTIYMVPLSAEEHFVPTDFLMLTLPATDGGSAEIDLTVSPGWTPKTTKWLLHLMTKTEDTNAGFSAVEFLPASTFTIMNTAFWHFFKQEPYTPSSYHALRGYRVLSRDVTMIIGFLVLLASILTIIFAKKGTKLMALVIVLFTFQALYGLRFGFDLLRFSSEHLTGYANGMYDEAGSVYQIAPSLRSLVVQDKKSEAETTVFVCRSGTNYKEKILRYFSYPIRISSDASLTASADYALVMNSRDWNVQTVSENGVNKQFLQCADLKLEATQIATFPDGSILFSLVR